jgi:2-aminophenol/2-amino-5-chlorophenol 1,6-dioxygenase beta subunit
MRANLDEADYDVIVILSPHWQTYVGTHFLGLPNFKSKSVDPIFPNLFRFDYDIDIDVELSRMIHDEAQADGMVVKMMENPDFRVDYGTIVSCHLTRPQWDKPVVCISSNRANAYYSVEVMQEMAAQLGRATSRAIEKSGKRALLLASNSLSHRHFITEPEIPEDMSAEHITSHHLYLWDMKLIEMMKQGKTKEIFDIMPEFTEQAVSESDGGGFSWILSALDFPTYPAIVHGYGTIIGTGNAVVEWPAEAAANAEVALRGD